MALPVQRRRVMNLDDCAMRRHVGMFCVLTATLLSGAAGCGGASSNGAGSSGAGGSGGSVTNPTGCPKSQPEVQTDCTDTSLVCNYLDPMQCPRRVTCVQAPFDTRRTVWEDVNPEPGGPCTVPDASCSYVNPVGDESNLFIWRYCIEGTWQSGTECPQSAPKQGANCYASLTCSYDVCGDAEKETTATCKVLADGWQISSGCGSDGGP
jgi:hypothetical protein